MTTLQIRDVPDEVSRQLKARAAASGQSLSQFALAELTRSLRRPSIDLLWSQIEADVTQMRHSTAATDLIRAERDARP